MPSLTPSPAPVSPRGATILPFRSHKPNQPVERLDEQIAVLQAIDTIREIGRAQYATRVDLEAAIDRLTDAADVLACWIRNDLSAGVAIVSCLRHLEAAEALGRQLERKVKALALPCPLVDLGAFRRALRHPGRTRKGETRTRRQIALERATL